MFHETKLLSDHLIACGARRSAAQRVRGPTSATLTLRPSAERTEPTASSIAQRRAFIRQRIMERAGER